MTTAAERLCLIIADISGYTGYLTGSELDHARDVMADLLETILGAMGPSPRLSELEGDALFVNVPEGEIDGSTLLDTLESCYFAFRRRVRSIAQATTCPCNACRAIRDLDLKFCVHTGGVVRQRIAGQEKLIGSDVILVHRLLKNSVADTFGLHAYILFTASCLERLGLDPGALRMMPHQESYEHFGQVLLYVHNLQARWNEREERHRVFVRPEEADVTMDLSYPAPPPLVWEYLTAPDKRPLWFVGVTDAYQENADRRRDVGTVIHCVHGPHSHVEEILDWRPFHSFTWVTSFPGLGVTTLTFNLVPVAPGTEVQILLRLASPIPTPEARLIADQVLDDARASFDKLVQVLARHMEARTEQLGTVAEARATLRNVASGSRDAREGLSASRLDTQSH
ncbi:MAG TPA: DUF2652 domain-containing protein [Nitrospiraceae bacterium]|nr:DUF2652 domain-containing protein [Nitrospiraceae bacterium]